MMTVRSAIQKLGLQEIQSLTDPTILEIIYAFDSAPNRSSLSKTLTEIYRPSDFLNNPAKRGVIIEHLEKNDAEDLAKLASINYQQDRPWDSLSSCRFTSSHQKKALYDFFEVSDLIEADAIEAKKEYISKQTITSGYPLFVHQEKAALSIKKTLLQNKRVLLHMPTGAGKTRTSMNIICDYLRSSIKQRQNKLVIWLADTEELCDQASEEFAKAWGFLGSGDVCHQRFYGNYDLALSEIGPGFLVAGLAKLNSRFDRDQQGMISLSRNCSLVVFDEAHKILANTYQHAVELFQEAGTAKLIGLSATPGRATLDEEENQKFAIFFDRKKVTLEVEGYDNPVQYLQDEGYLANVRYHSMPYVSKNIKLTDNEVQSLSNKNDVPDRVLKELGKDTVRNIKILTLAMKLIKKKKKIILFACSVAHTEALYALLKYKGIKVGAVTSNTEKNQRRNMIESYKKGDLDILVNFGVLTTGFDAPITNVAIIARPTTSLTLYSQMVGRAARGTRAGGSKDCDIYTVVDEVIPGFRNITEAFKHWDDAWE